MSGESTTKSPQTLRPENLEAPARRLAKNDALPPVFEAEQGLPPQRRHAQTKLPLVRVPSRFKPEMFLKASSARGARPAGLKLIDSHLTMVERTIDPRERFERLKSLKKVLDDFVLRYTKNNSRRRTADALKKWVDGAIRLREPMFELKVHDVEE